YAMALARFGASTGDVRRIEQGVAPDRVERREALAPTSLGSRIPGGGPRWARPSCAGRSLRKGSAKGASQAPMGSRKPLAPPAAPSPRSGGERTRGNGAPAPQRTGASGALATHPRWLTVA